MMGDHSSTTVCTTAVRVLINGTGYETVSVRVNRRATTNQQTFLLEMMHRIRVACTTKLMPDSFGMAVLKKAYVSIIILKLDKLLLRENILFVSPRETVISTRRHPAQPSSVPFLNPFSTAVPFWGQTT